MIARLFDVTSYSHPPAKEQVSPDVLAVTLKAFVKFELGVPIAINATIPVLSFLKTASTEEIFAQTSSNLTNALSVTASTSGLTCSFAGGCEYEVTSNSLAIMMNNNSTANYISVCDEVCVYN
jgi:hypothetical protein